MAGCPSSVKLLCDSGASVNASDFVRIVISLNFTQCAVMVSSGIFFSFSMLVVVIVEKCIVGPLRKGFDLVESSQ